MAAAASGCADGPNRTEYWMDDHRTTDGPKCYAAGLGDCYGKVNREHYVSRSVLEQIGDGKSVTVTNLPFLEKDIPREIGIGSLTAKVLCERHNSGLSELDTTGAKMFAAMETFTGSAGQPSTPAETIRIDGDTFERWLLKLFCGGLFSGNIRIPEFGPRVGKPPPTELTQVLFGMEKFRPYKGLYLHGESPDKPINTDGNVFKTSALHISGIEVLVGVRVWLFGFQFDLVAFGVSFGLPRAMRDASYRPAGLSSVSSNIQINFEWRDGPQSPIVVFDYLGERPAPT
jgi:hypothetical protein